TNSIVFDDKVVHNGIQKYKIKWETCYRLRPFVADHWGSCLTCVTVCPYTKPNVWWRSLAVWALHATPPPARPPLVRALKAIDDRFWGAVPQKRVRWLGYDSGIKPGEQACTVAGCTAQHDEKGHSGRGGHGAPRESPEPPGVRGGCGSITDSNSEANSPVTERPPSVVAITRQQGRPLWQFLVPGQSGAPRHAGTSAASCRVGEL